MSDRRVVRGSTYAAKSTVDTFRVGPSAYYQQDAEWERNKQMSVSHRPLKKKRPMSQTVRVASQPQAKVPLQELPGEIEEDTTMDEGEYGIPVLEPLFIPKPDGKDVGTMIRALDLFDFDLSVEPYLEQIIGRCLHQSKHEVELEEAVKAEKNRRNLFEATRNVGVVLNQRLAAEDARRQDERARRNAQEAERLLAEKLVEHKRHARLMAQAYMKQMKAGVTSKIEQHGHFYDHLVREVKTQFVPWIVKEISAQLQDVAEARMEVNNVLALTVQTLIDEASAKVRRESPFSFSFSLSVFLLFRILLCTLSYGGSSFRFSLWFFFFSFTRTPKRQRNTMHSSCSVRSAEKSSR